MADSAEKTTKKPGFFKNVQIEFKKIIWPDKKTMFKQSVAVVVIAVVAGLLITAIDRVVLDGIEFLISL